MSDHPIGSDGCTCRLHLYERPGSHPGNAVAFSPDCPHHRPALSDDVVMVGDVAFTREELAAMPWSHVLPWRPTDSDS